MKGRAEEQVGIAVSITAALFSRYACPSSSSSTIASAKKDWIPFPLGI
jgi:hypothetical protein